MIQSTPRKVFINLPIRDLAASTAFFTKLGFTFNAQFTDEKATCMVLSEEAFVMLLTEPFFRTFTKREICATSTHSEALLALSCVSRAEVDELVKTAIEAGGSAAMPAVDHGFMYGATFYDLDGHHWEVLWMDPAFVQKT
jgi:predicted lactoylglutathione lyase